MKIDLRELRFEMYKSQKEFADAIGISRTAYREYDNGTLELNANQFYLLQQAFKQEIMLPYDFKKYTLKTVKYNMEHYEVYQRVVAEILGIKQARMSQLLKLEKYSIYGRELPEYFLYDYKDELKKMFCPYLIEKK